VRHRNTARLRLALLLIPLALVAGACQMNPAKRKSELVASAERYVAAGEYRKAIIEYKNALKIDRRSAELHYKLGQAYIANGQLQEGLLSYAKAIDLDPDYAPALIARGKFYLAAKLPDKATQDAQAVLAKSPDNIDAQILLADAYARKNDLPAAIKVVEASSNGILTPSPPASISVCSTLGRANRTQLSSSSKRP